MTSSTPRCLRQSCPALTLIWALLVALPFPAGAGLRVTGYYPGYRQSYLPPSAIDFSALTHIIQFSIVPKPDGSLNTTANGLTPAYASAGRAARRASRERRRRQI
jgi:hypothetical protein